MIPEKIPIQRIEDYHTHFLGKARDGKQFFGYETFVFPAGIPSTDWEKVGKITSFSMYSTATEIILLRATGMPAQRRKQTNL